MLLGMEVRIGARKSTLARIQALAVGEALSRRHPETRPRYLFRDSAGDLDQSSALTSFGNKGVFTEDFYAALCADDLDLVVHSWKDLPVEERPLTTIAGTLPRADCRDVLLLRRDAEPAPGDTLLILSSSPRRAYNLGPFLEWALPWRNLAFEFLPVRGNIETRLKKLLSGEAEALVVAKAALDRLLEAETFPDKSFSDSAQRVRAALSECHIMVLPLSVNPAAPAQGALAIEVRRDRDDLHELIDSISDHETFGAVSAERRTLAKYGGGCHQKIGTTVLQRFHGTVQFLRGLTDSGQVLNETVHTRVGGAFPRAESAAHIWPAQGGGDELFERHPLPADETVLDPALGLWVSRADSLPEAWKIPPRQIVWTAGLKTWRKLAARGVWVTGSADGLGEDESPGLERLVPGLKGFIKLSHDEGFESDHMQLVHTYKLVPKPGAAINVKGRTHFFWMSGSQFKYALERAPEIGAAWHGCGPGNTYKILSKILGDEKRLRVFLSYEEFLREVQPDTVH